MCNRIFRVEEHTDDDEAVIRQCSTLQRSVVEAPYLPRRIGNARRSPVERLHERDVQLAGVVARIADHGELKPSFHPLRQSYGLRIHPYVVLRVADARPAAIVHVPGGHAPSDPGKRQAVSIVVRGPDGRSGHRAEPAEEHYQAARRHLVCSIEEEGRPSVGRGVAVAMTKDVGVLVVQITDGGSIVGRRRPMVVARHCIILRVAKEYGGR